MIRDKDDDELIDEHVFQNEESILHKAQEVILAENNSAEVLRQEYQQLAANYEKLLEDVKLLTKVSDKLQNKLHQINESLVQKTLSLEQAQKIIQDQNEELKLAKHDLENTVRIRTKDLNKAYSDLLMTNKELDSFVYRASHDIRGPLATFLGLCYLAKLEVTDAKALEYFEMLNVTAKRMDEILDKLLSINKLKNTTVHLVWLDLSTMLQKVIAAVYEKETFRNVQIMLNAPESMMMHGDGEVLTSLLTNVLENAVNNFIHTVEERTVPEPIYIDLYQKEHTGYIRVRYRGIVIPIEHKEKIFEIFHRIHHRSDITGLRLYSAKLASEKLSGDIVLIESNYEHTVFEVSLPLLQQD